MKLIKKHLLLRLFYNIGSKLRGPLAQGGAERPRLRGPCAIGRSTRPDLRMAAD